MVLKRKRSESELSYTSSSTFNSPPLPERFTMMMDLADTSPLRLMSINNTPAHLHSRTLKRFRDSRPSEEEVHQRTLNMLYTAQKQHIAQQQQQLQLGSFTTQPRPQPTTTQSEGTYQASLHNFWNLPNSANPLRAVVPPPVDHVTYDGPTDCEDCGQTLREGTNGDPMDADGSGMGAKTSCAACGKHVCSHCSITNLGEQRRCLICAGKKVWTGGQGWAGFGVRI
ncbi:hypothetical protein AAE478_009231 [Parahypoxylon ruwenzoriense]